MHPRRDRTFLTWMPGSAPEVISPLWVRLCLTRAFTKATSEDLLRMSWVPLSVGNANSQDDAEPTPGGDGRLRKQQRLGGLDNGKAN